MTDPGRIRADLILFLMVLGQDNRIQRMLFDTEHLGMMKETLDRQVMECKLLQIFVPLKYFVKWIKYNFLNEI